MSDPTYRIDVEHKPANEHIKWVSKIIRLSDERLIEVCTGTTSDLALTAAQEWLAAENGKVAGFSLFVDDDGQRVEAHSVKA